MQINTYFNTCISISLIHNLLLLLTLVGVAKLARPVGLPPASKLMSYDLSKIRRKSAEYPPNNVPPKIRRKKVGRAENPPKNWASQPQMLTRRMAIAN